VLDKVVQSLMALGKRRNCAKEQAVRELLEGDITERRALLDQIEAGWQSQTPCPTAAEVDAWITVGRY
jgi:hypothetical protein